MGTHSNMIDYLLIQGSAINFESGEHESIGNKVLLRYDSRSIYGTDFGYTVGSNTLSYGLVVALAGDFYGNFTSLPGDVEQISDKWDTDPESSIALGLSLAKSLSSDQAGYLSRVLSSMKNEETTVNNRMKNGEDVAQIFDSIGSSYDKEYTIDTRPLGAYLWIALCNWDHFGQDAEKAYSAVHTAALRQAKKAHDDDQSNADANLKEAYFLEGYAQHFLTDLFSSGHLRTPRRILHRNLVSDPDDPENDPTTPNVAPYPTDRCAQKMHNEDCANGLWVTNQKGDSWATYGDKQLWSGKSNQCFLQAVKAAQAGATEVWETRQSGNIPLASDFAALQLTPILDNLHWPINFAPLFQERQDEPGKVLYRADFDRRDEFNYSKMSENPSFYEWQSMLRNISKSGEDTNMYPFTRQFLSPTILLHIREVDDSHMILNTYGSVDSGTYGSEWTMTLQVDVEFPEIVGGSMQWIKATSLGYGVRSLVGRFKPSSNDKWSTHHLGLKFTLDDPSSAAIVWSYTLANDNNSWTPGDIVYGDYSQDSSNIGMIKYWTKGPRGASKLELWTIDASLQDAPVKQTLTWSTIPLNFMLSYQIQSSDTFETFIGYGFDSSTSSTTWYFSTWTGGYSTQVLTTYSDSVSFPAQVLLSGKFGTDDDGYRLVRVFYGPTFTKESRMRIDILNPSRDSTGKITFNSDPVTKTVLITWGAYFPADYLTWILEDASSDNLLDLIGLAVMPDSSLSVIVFPGLSDFTFGSPIVSKIALDPAQGKLLTAPFMTHLTALKARFTYPETTVTNQAITSPAAILALFDNYGVLGARMLAPVVATGTWNYEFKGQTPAVSGQPSQALGLTSNNWMGRGEQPQSIGLLLEK